MYKVIASGSTGNSIIYHDSIMVDCGVPFSKIKEFANKLQIVLISHAHFDHFNLTTLKKLSFERPSLRFGVGPWMVEKMDEIRNIDVMEAGQMYDYRAFQISPVKLYHDVTNYGFRIFKDGKKIIHCTDTAHLEGITAKNYDLFAIEHNYDEETIHEKIAEIEKNGGFAHQKGAINSHLSEQQARDFIYKNRGEHSQVLRLHESKS
jgi:L-ascorbate metabolism protein UlaG (beta-lactamase superfamily)